MDQIISELRQKLNKFKSWIESPRLYIVDELDEIKNEIDIFAERFLTRASKNKTKSDEQIKKDHDKINSNRRQMIDEIEAFEKKILANMPTNVLEPNLAKKLTLSIKELDKKLQSLEKKLTSKSNKNVTTEKASFDLEFAIDSVIYEFDCAIKQKSSLLFINVFFLKKSLNSHSAMNEIASEYARREAEYLCLNQSDLAMESDENYRD